MGLQTTDSVLRRTMLVTNALFCYSLVILLDANEHEVFFCNPPIDHDANTHHPRKVGQRDALFCDC